MRSPADPTPVIAIQADVEVPEEVTEKSVTSLVRHILDAENVMGEWEMGIHFVDDLTMQAAHLEFMDIDEPTDIMTFPYEDEDDFGPDASGEWAAQARGGDLIISVDRAEDHALAAGWATDQELYFLIAHGVLHLLGWDDATDEDRRAMLNRQSDLLTEWNATREAKH